MSKLVKILLACLVCITALNASKQDENWWKEKLKNDDLRYGYYDIPELIIAVSKVKRKLDLFEYDHGELKGQFDSNVMVGKNGQKLIEGDLKTPVGVYELTARFKPKDTYLGPLAFSLSYPNLLDKIQGRKGSGIWIHGYPLNGGRTDDNTRGCIVLKNDLLLDFDTHIDHIRALAVVSEDSYTYGNLDEISSILATLYQWQNAWIQSDIKWYLSFYDKSFKRYDGMKFNEFSAYKSRIFAKKEKKRINFSKLSLTPYPDIGQGRIYRLSFHESYKAKSHKFEGEKVLFIRINENGEPKIILEK